MGVATEATDFEIAIARVQRVADRRRRLCGALQAYHTLVPSLAREPVGLLAGSPRLLRCGTDRTAVDRFPRLRAHSQRWAHRAASGKPLDYVVQPARKRIANRPIGRSPRPHLCKAAERRYAGPLDDASLKIVPSNPEDRPCPGWNLFFPLKTCYTLNAHIFAQPNAGRCWPDERRRLG
jgi:hypothetical protein